MGSPFPSRVEMRSLLKLAMPIIFMQLGLMSYGVIDTLFMARIGAWAVAGVGIGNAGFYAIFLFGMGILYGIDPLASKAFGAGKRDACAEIFIHALFLTPIIITPLFFLLYALPLFYRAMGVVPSVTATALEYVHILKWMLIPGLLFSACRQYLQSMDVTRPLLFGIVSGIVVNICMDYALVFGHWGFPKMGVRGCAVASVATTTVMMLFAAFASYRHVVASGYRWRGLRSSLLLELARLGLPAGSQTLVEMSMFTIVTTLMGRFGPIPAAAHQITMNFAALTFMIPMGMSAAAAVRVGQGLGQNDPQAAVGAGRTALLLGVVFMIFMAFIFWAIPQRLIGLYTQEAEVLQIGASLLVVAGLFQIFDGAQVVLTGALRGFSETRLPLLINLAGFTCLGIPLGYWLAFHAGFGPRGLWFGLLAGLSSVAVLLFFVWRRRAVAALAT